MNLSVVTRALVSLFLITGFSAYAIKLEPVLTKGLKETIHVETAPGEPNRLYVVEQAGRILVIENGKLLPTPFLDIRSKVISGGELGLLSVAFHPNYAVNRRYFVNYTSPTPRLETVIAEYRAGSTTEKPLLRIYQPYRNHNGGLNLFGPDGMLYIGMGDGGSAGDPENYSQNPQSLLGKMLRIDVNSSTGGKPYGIPSDNPFLDGSARPEIWALGLRNPWRFAFDLETGLMYAGDVGQYRWEEIDIVEKGGNYGWNVTEGFSCFKPPQGCSKAGLIDPIHQYDRDAGVSITGGLVYRGRRIPELVGAYLYGDYGTGNVWALRYDPVAKKVVSNDLLLQTSLPIASFGADADGEILVVSHQGAIHRIAK